MAKVKVQVKVSYWVGMEFDGMDNEEVIASLKNLDNDLISYTNETNVHEDIVTDWFREEFNERDSYMVEYEIEQLEIDNEEIF